MKRIANFPGLLLALWLLPIVTQAQSLWILSYRGTETHAISNRLITMTVTDKTLIERCAVKAGIATDGLALVLRFDAGTAGDVLEVVNVNDPNVFRCEVFRFAFSESYTSAGTNAFKRFAYIYDETSGHSRGSVVFSRRASGKKGAGSMTMDGKMHYWLGVWHESVSDPNAIVGSGTFSSKGAID